MFKKYAEELMLVILAVVIMLILWSIEVGLLDYRPATKMGGQLDPPQIQRLQYPDLKST